jgi:type VI secretion system protein ImpK
MPDKPPIDDPFAEISGGRTFIMPTPGARAAAPGTAAPRATSGTPNVAGDIEPIDSGLNPLVATANRLLALVPQIRATYTLADPAALRESIASEVRAFESTARARGIAPERILAARYVLCTVLDEAAASTPWGGSGQWGRHSLLTMFHNEASGGEKVFQLMAKLAQDAPANRDLLELIYAALSVGFEGRYRVATGGAAQLEAVRERLAQVVRKERGDHSPALAQHWRGVLPKRRPLLTWLPLAATAAVTALLLAGTYLFLSLRLAQQSDPTYARILALKTAAPPAPVRAAAPAPRLAPLLQAEIQAGQVTVRDELDRSIVTLLGDGLFAPASATVSPSRVALFSQVAAALSKVPGSVLVTGHTDNIPIGTARFPSNWHLSQGRAAAVRDLLVGAGLPTARVRAEGRADGEPVAPNDSPTNRSQNRRVEITLVTGVVTAATAPAAAQPAPPAKKAPR